MPPLRYREPIVLRPSEAHTATVIMLHGLGDSGEGWAPVGDEWAPALPHAKFVFPHAPMVCATPLTCRRRFGRVRGGGSVCFDFFACSRHLVR